MTIVPASTRTTSHTLSSATAGPFNVGFRIFDATLAVYVNEALRTDYTVSATFTGGFSDAATITFSSALASGDIIRIDGDMPISRGAEYLNPDPSLTTKLNIEQGRQWAAMQQLQRDVGRAPDIGGFDSRDELVLWRASNAPIAGRTYFFSGTALRGATGSAILPSLADLRPVGNVADAALLGLTTGTVSDAVALTNAQRINAWLAEADCNVFDWGGNLIGVAETIALGRNGNGVIGRAAHAVFGAALSGAIVLWQGAAGGVMFRVRNASNSLDILSPSIIGLELNGNALAGFPLIIEGVQKGRVGPLNIRNFRSSNAGDFAVVVRNNSAGGVSGAQVNCAYGVMFTQVTISCNGLNNGVYLSGTSGTSGQNTTFCIFDHLHISYANGDALIIDDADDVNIIVLGTSRQPGGTGRGLVLSSTVGPAARIVTGNIIHNANFSKSAADPAVPVVFDGANVIGNCITVNGVDAAPNFQFLNGALRELNPGTRFLGQPNYAGGWTVKPWQVMAPLPNIDSTDPLVLDHYEEGTFTPTFAFGGASTGNVYGLQTGTFQRIGNRVHVQANISLTTKGSATGLATIAGLPYASVQSGGGAAFTFYFGLSSAAVPMGAVGGTSLSLRKAGGTGSVDMTDTDFTSTTRLDFSASYRVA